MCHFRFSDHKIKEKVKRKNKNNFDILEAEKKKVKDEWFKRHLWKTTHSTTILPQKHNMNTGSTRRIRTEGGTIKLEENKTLLHLERRKSLHSHPGAVQVCGCKTPSAHQWGTSTPPPLPLQQQNGNDLLFLPLRTSGHVCINTHSAWSGLLHHHPAFQWTPEVLPQGRRPKQPHTYGTATHTLSMCPRERVSVFVRASVSGLGWRRQDSTLHMSGSVPTKDVGPNEGQHGWICSFSVCCHAALDAAICDIWLNPHGL